MNAMVPIRKGFPQANVSPAGSKKILQTQCHRQSQQWPRRTSPSLLGRSPADTDGAGPRVFGPGQPMPRVMVCVLVRARSPEQPIMRTFQSAPCNQTRYHCRLGARSNADSAADSTDWGSDQSLQSCSSHRRAFHRKPRKLPPYCPHCQKLIRRRIISQTPT